MPDVDWREGYVAGGPTRFFVRVLGHGDDVVVLLHGWPENGRAWRDVAPLFAEAGWRVACPDLKGFGRTHGTGDYDSQTVADELSRLVTALHVRKAVIVGHDWGGAVALATAFRHPGRVRHLVVANSPYRRIDLRRAWHIPLFNLPLVPEIAFRVQARRLVRLAIRHAAVVPEAFDDDILDEYAQHIAQRPGAWLAYYRTMSRGAVMDRARGLARRALPWTLRSGQPHRLRVPCTVVWGAEDPVLPLSLGRETAEDLDAELVPIPGVGHFPHEEDAQAFAHAVLRAIGPVSLRPAEAPDG